MKNVSRHPGNGLRVALCSGSFRVICVFDIVILWVPFFAATVEKKILGTVFLNCTQFRGFLVDWIDYLEIRDFRLLSKIFYRSREALDLSHRIKKKNSASADNGNHYDSS